jgi:hypothetical protein
MSGGVYASNYWYRLDQAWSQSRASISRQFLNASSVVNSALTDAASNQISGTANLAAEAALKRIKSKTAAVTAAKTGVAATAPSATSTTAKSTPATATTSSSASGSSQPPRYNRFA